MAVIIGICGGLDYQENNIYLRRTYALAVEKAGALPLILPPLKDQRNIPDLLAVVDGLVLAGGGDINPYYIKEDPYPALGKVDPERDRCELALARLAWKDRKPVLGICRGMQVMNIALGGDIYQDLVLKEGDLLQHEQKSPPWNISHKIEISTALAYLSKERFWPVNSLHHQGVRKLAPDLKACAKSSDGLVEALMAEDKRYYLGVQWHPEWLGNVPWGFGLFSDLIEKIKRNFG